MNSDEQPRTDQRVYHTTGLHKDDIVDLCARLRQYAQDREEGTADVPALPSVSWPPVLGLFKSVVVTLVYLRRNRVQVDLAETYHVSQPTISRAIGGLTPAIGHVLREHVPVAEDLDESRQYIVDGTLLPCWSWKSHPQLYSGKHKTTGKNVQVACTHSGRLVWISDPYDGSRHDSYAIQESGILTTFSDGRWIGDKGYVGLGMLTPTKKPQGGELTPQDKAHNRAINQVRYVIERTIA